MSALKRFFVEKIEDTVELVGEEFEHAKNVLRLSNGDEVILLDNSGNEYTAVIAAVEKKRMLLNVVRCEVGTREANADVCLLFGYLKNADKNGVRIIKTSENELDYLYTQVKYKYPRDKKYFEDVVNYFKKREMIDYYYSI